MSAHLPPGEAVEEGEGVFDPSMLCSVEITAGRDSDSTPTPTPQGPPRKKKKLVRSQGGKEKECSVEKSPVFSRPGQSDGL